MKTKNEIMVGTKSIKECVADCDIIVTTTPSRRPLVQLQWLKPGVHINAIGADAPGKQELDFNILKNSKIIIDDWKQAAHSGEINVALKRKRISKRNIYAELGHIVAGKKKGRQNKKDITVFDSTGLAIQDAAIAMYIYKTAVKLKAGKWFNLVS